MKAGLVRIGSRSLLALAVVGLSACNSDPLKFNPKTGTQLSTNPSAMVVNGGGAQRLRVNVLNDGFEPTFDVPSLVEGTSGECTLPVTGGVSFKELPAATGGGSAITEPIDSVLATGAQPPNVYDVTGVGIGNTCLIASFGSLVEEIPVAVVPFALGLTGPDSIADGDFTLQTYVVVAFDTDSTINTTFDASDASFVTVATDDTLIARVVNVNPGSIEVMRGPLGGTAVLTVTTDQDSVIRTVSQNIVVEKPSPQVAMLSPASGGAGDTVTITGTQLSIKGFNGTQTIVSVNGLDLANVISESATQLVVEMPSFSATGTYPVIVDVDGVTVAAGNWDQTSPYSNVGCGPACESPGGVSTTVPFDFAGDISGGVTDQFFTFFVSRDMDITMNLDWTNAATDVDLLVTDGAFTAYVCTDGATGSKPEQSVCHTEDVDSYLFWVNVYAGPDPGGYTADATVTAFN